MKCPVRGCGKRFKGMGYLNEHFDNDHSPTNISLNLAKLIEKIEDRIEHLEGHGIYIEYDDVDVIKMLKNLLK
jgi:hypothetical protein